MADALGSGPSESNLMQVQLLLSAPEKNKTNLEREQISNSKFVLFFNKNWYGITMFKP